ncbi:MAG: 30S ribosomal protein S1 [Gemmataceae bacterium]
MSQPNQPEEMKPQDDVSNETSPQPDTSPLALSSADFGFEKEDDPEEAASQETAETADGNVDRDTTPQSDKRTRPSLKSQRPTNKFAPDAVSSSDFGFGKNDDAELQQVLEGNESTPEKKEREPDPVFEARLERMREKQQKSKAVPHLEQDPTFMPEVSPKDMEDEVERELAEAMGGMSIEDMYGDMRPKKRNEPNVTPEGKRKGTIISIRGQDVFVELPGNRSQGMLPINQFHEGKPSVGDEVEVNIEGYDNQNGLLVLTREGAAVEADWNSVAVGMIVEARAIETNKGGLTVMVNGIRGFLPISQIDLYRVENAEPFVNERFRCLVTDVDPVDRNLIVSRRAMLEKEREEKREQLWAELAEGQVREGVVSRVEHFGAFVDLGGVDGLLHISEMSWFRVNNAKEIVQPGQSIKVAVLRVDHEGRKVALGLKQLEPGPWDNIEVKYPIGTVHKGKVVKLLDFGAIVELEAGIEGLVHISEAATHRVRSITEAVQLDQEVNVQIMDINEERKRISLSIKGAAAQEAEEAEQEAEDDETDDKKPKQKPRTTPLKGGIGGGQGGGLFDTK